MQTKILITLLPACGTAQAAEWVSLGKTANGTVEAFVDVSSIRVVSGIRRAWVKLVYAPHTQKGGLDAANKWKSGSVSREAFNCSEETEEEEADIIYYDDGTTWSAPANLFPTPWAPVPPDTMQSLEMQLVCAWKRQ